MNKIRVGDVDQYGHRIDIPFSIIWGKSNQEAFDKKLKESTKLLTKKGTRSFKDTMKIVKKVAERVQSKNSKSTGHDIF